jgi:hypothetical protein
MGRLRYTDYMMTRKHFEAIARINKQMMDNPTVPSDSRITLIAVAHLQANFFATENPNFDRQRFLTASGVQ